MAHTVEVQRVERQFIGAVRRRAKSGELSKVVPAACGEAWDLIKAAGIQGAGRLVAMYLDSEINMEIGAEVPQPFERDDRLICSATPAGLVVTTVHMGPYQGLHDAHAAIRQWCSDHQRRTAGPSWEIYGHWDEDPSKLRTDIFYLLDSEHASAD